MYFALLCLVVALSVAVFLGGRRRRTRRHARATEIVRTEAEKHGWSEARQAAVTAGDSYTSAAAFPNALSEPITPTDSLVDNLISGGGGPQTYNESFIEAVTLGDSIENAAIFAQAFTEAVTLTDDAASTSVLRQAISEAVTLEDSLSGGAGYAQAVSESISLTDAMVDGGGHSPRTYSESFTEPLNLGDGCQGGTLRGGGSLRGR